MYIIRRVIPECGSIKGKTVIKVFFLFVYRLVEVRIYQEPLIWVVVSCAKPCATNRQMMAQIVIVLTEGIRKIFM